MASNIGGPLFMLQWKGILCSCLQSREDSEAHRAVKHIQGLRVQWHRQQPILAATKQISGFMSGLFGGSSSSGDGGNDGKSGNDGISSRLELKDTEEKGPELIIKPIQSSETVTDSGGSIRMKQSAGFMKTIPLKQVDRVIVQDETYIVLQSTKGNSIGGGNNNSSKKIQDLARLRLTATTEHPTDTKEALLRILEWNQRRLDAIPDEDRELEDVAQNGIQRRAQTAAHFAKREVEMQQQKREREKKKAALGVQGMKYTALAMANREE